MDELARIQTGELKSTRGGQEGRSFEFVCQGVCGHSDVEQFRPNADACPSFASHLKTANEKGVQVLPIEFDGVGSDEEGTGE